MRIYLTLLLLLIGAHFVGAQNTMRVKAYSLYRETNVTPARMLDSTVYKYSNNRGSELSYLDNESFFQDYYGAINYPNREVSLLCDTAWSYQDTGKGLEILSINSAEYDVNNRRKSFTCMYTPRPGQRLNGDQFILKRDAAGKLIQEEYYQLGAGTTWGLYYTTGYYYDVQDRLVTDSSCHDVYYCGMRKYYYNSAGQLIEQLDLGNHSGGPFDTFERHNYYYNSNGKVSTTSHSTRNDMNNTWETSALDSFIYDGQNTLIERYALHNDPQLNVMQLAFRERMQYDALGDITEKINEKWNNSSQSWDITAKVVFTYRSDGLLSRMVREEYTPNQIPTLTTATTNIYYEPVRNADIQDNIATGNSIIVYPNPTSSSLTVKCANSASIVSMQISDMTGRVVVAIEHMEDEIAVDVSRLTPGNYLLACVDEFGNRSVQLLAVE